jgi:Zn-dependent peptidase ImmA (M78 family)/DNA-binding XRE family transcriptional regulator
MAKRAEALINHELLIWARKNAGLNIDLAAKKAGVPAERLASWERGENRPTINQLRRLAQAYKRPLAVFYLDKPPRDFQPLRDYRQLTPIPQLTESPGLLLEVRRAWARRDIAIELYRDLDEKPPQFHIAASTADDPETLALKIRHTLGITLDIQTGFGGQHQALNWWRDALENNGILVFQATAVDVSEMRGFSLSEKPLPVVVVNIKDSPLARIFSMLHELVHVSIRQGGICDLDEVGHRHPAEQQVEVFSNRVAGAVLIPEKELLADELVLAHPEGLTTWSDNEVASLARRYWVSQEVLLRRLLICGLTTQEFYHEKRTLYAARRKPSDKGFAPPAQMAISAAGRAFVRLVLDNYYRENITSSDVADFLNVKLKHLGEIEQKVMGHNVLFGAVA